MIEQECKELNERLAKAVGIKKIYYEEWDTEHSCPMFIPSGKPWRTHQIDAMPVPKFYLSVDTCIKLIYPILHKPVEIGNIKLKDGAKGWCCRIGNSGWQQAASFPLAFCMAADKSFEEVSNAH